MSKKTILIIISTVWMVMGGGRLAAQNLFESAYAYQAASTLKLRTQIEFLADSVCAGRGMGSKEMSRATMWLMRRFEDIGLQPLGDSYMHPFCAENGAIGRNIIGMIPNGKSFSTTYTIVMAHYDGLGKIGKRWFPGADSNASGVAGLLALAEVFTGMRKCGQLYDGNLIFVATDGKDVKMAGADALHRMLEHGWCKNPFTRKKITLDQIALVVNLDQIGSTMSPLSPQWPEYLIMLGNDSLPSDQQSLLGYCNHAYGFNLDLSFSYYGSKNFTETFYHRAGEQKYFVRDGIPSVMFTSGITMNTNKTYDNVRSLNLDVMRKRILLIFKWLEKMIEAQPKVS